MYSGTSDDGPSEIGTTSLQGQIGPIVSLVRRFHCKSKPGQHLCKCLLQDNLQNGAAAVGGETRPHNTPPPYRQSALPPGQLSSQVNSMRVEMRDLVHMIVTWK